MERRVRALLFVSNLALAGCDPASPTSPTRPNSPNVVSLTITAATSLHQPGDTARLTATATFSDDTSRDVTADANWSGQEGVIDVSGPGVITATHFGIGTVSARYRTTTATAWVRVAPAGAFLINGSVRAAGGFQLAEAVVTASSGCGTHTVRTDVFGSYVLPAEGEATMRAEREGLRSQVRYITAQADTRIDFELQRLDMASDLSGPYRLAVTASRSCTLPAEVMQRSYDANILQMRQDLLVRLSGADLVAWGGETGFTGSRDGDAVRFVVRDTFDDGYNFIERIDRGRDLYYSGTASGEADQTRIVAMFDGTLELRAYGGGRLAICQARDHRFELIRSGATPPGDRGNRSTRSGS